MMGRFLMCWSFSGASGMIGGIGSLSASASTVGIFASDARLSTSCSVTAIDLASIVGCNVMELDEFVTRSESAEELEPLPSTSILVGFEGVSEATATSLAGAGGSDRTLVVGCNVLELDEFVTRSESAERMEPMPSTSIVVGFEGVSEVTTTSLASAGGSDGTLVVGCNVMELDEFVTRSDSAEELEPLPSTSILVGFEGVSEATATSLAGAGGSDRTLVVGCNVLELDEFVTRSESAEELEPLPSTSILVGFEGVSEATATSLAGAGGSDRTLVVGCNVLELDEFMARSAFAEGMESLPSASIWGEFEGVSEVTATCLADGGGSERTSVVGCNVLELDEFVARDEAAERVGPLPSVSIWGGFACVSEVTATCLADGDGLGRTSVVDCVDVGLDCFGWIWALEGTTTSASLMSLT